MGEGQAAEVSVPTGEISASGNLPDRQSNRVKFD